MSEVKIYAHRCAPLDGPENDSLSAQKALDSGADGFEIDVRLSKDGYAMVVHDENLTRLSAGRHNQKISELKKERLKELGILNLFWFLHLAKLRDKKIFIELKEKSFSDAEKLVGDVCREIKATGVENNAIVISFRERDLAIVKAKNSAVKTGLIIETFSQIRGINAFSLLENDIVDYVFFGWDPEEPKTKWLFKAALWYLFFTRKMPVRVARECLFFSGIAQNKKDVKFLRKWGFVNIFTDSIKALKN